MWQSKVFDETTETSTATHIEASPLPIMATNSEEVAFHDTQEDWEATMVAQPSHANNRYIEPGLSYRSKLPVRISRDCLVTIVQHAV
jgi:hypothetical protein